MCPRQAFERQTSKEEIVIVVSISIKMFNYCANTNIVRLYLHFFHFIFKKKKKQKHLFFNWKTGRRTEWCNISGMLWSEVNINFNFSNLFTSTMHYPNTHLMDEFLISIIKQTNCNCHDTIIKLSFFRLGIKMTIAERESLINAGVSFTRLFQRLSV